MEMENKLAVEARPKAEEEDSTVFSFYFALVFFSCGFFTWVMLNKSLK